jgi:hypothetical protein
MNFLCRRICEVFFAQQMFFVLSLMLLFPVSCNKMKAGETDAAAVFEELWGVMNRRYALFNIKTANWDDVYTKYKPRFNSNMQQHELFGKLDDMLKELKDGHVALISPFDTSVYTQFYTAYSRNFNFNNVKKNYLQNEYKTSGPLIYKVVNQTGYIYYSSFANEIKDEDIASVLAQMSNVKGLIIDVRSNTGGSIQNAVKFAGHFIRETRVAKYERIKKGEGRNDFFEPQPFYITPAVAPFLKKVIVLTNRACYSACNDFVLYMMEEQHAQTVGDQTGGGGGLPYNYILLNGWKLQYTATETLSPAQIQVEDGLKPDIFMQISSLDEAAGIDPILEKAIQLIQ